MDKQAQNFKNSQIPINTRTIGTPEGIYILYLEDYVHTFIKKMLSLQEMRDVVLMTKEECRLERGTQPDILLFGKNIEENGRYNLVVSGAAAVTDEGDGGIRQINDKYFPGCSYIGQAYISLNKDLGLRLELALNNTRVILDDFYIYYDQNEEMQNYLIEWNTDKENGRSIDESVVNDPVRDGIDLRGSMKNNTAGNSGTRTRGNADDAVRLGRIAQAYNKEEVKVSFMWNVMNVLCLSFVVCVMVYGIISINNYSKMQNMQTNIDYCMAVLAQNISLNTKKSAQDGQAVTTMQQIGDTNVQDMQEAPEEENTVQAAPAAEDTRQNAEMAENAAQSGEIAETLPQNTEMTETLPQNTETAETLAQNTEMTETLAQNTETAETLAQNTETAENAAQNDQPQENTAQNAETAASAAAGSAPQVPSDTSGDVPKYYVVRKGDTLRTICFDIYGDYSRVEEVCERNNIENPDNILYGQKLLLP